MTAEMKNSIARLKYEVMEISQKVQQKDQEMENMRKTRDMKE